MTEAFSRFPIFGREGYDCKMVDQFFKDARHAYEGGVPANQFSAEQVQQASFLPRKRGYRVEEVDAAMDRLEAAFIERDRANDISLHGESAWYERVADRATTLYPRLMRPRGERFSHPRSEQGYECQAVDDLLDRLADFFDDRGPMAPEDIRKVLFPAAKGKKAYSEGVVDAYLARAVEILMAVG